MFHNFRNKAKDLDCRVGNSVFPQLSNNENRRSHITSGERCQYSSTSSSVEVSLSTNFFVYFCNASTPPLHVSTSGSYAKKWCAGDTSPSRGSGPVAIGTFRNWTYLIILDMCEPIPFDEVIAQERQIKLIFKFFKNHALYMNTTQCLK